MDTKSKIKIMQAWVDGKKVQYRSTLVQSDWHDVHCAEPGWYWKDFEYRIKPEPREWGNVYVHCNSGAIANDRVINPEYWNGPIKVREVLE